MTNKQKAEGVKGVNPENFKKMAEKLESSLKDPGWTVMGVGGSDQGCFILTELLIW
jgi:hypothetical protein